MRLVLVTFLAFCFTASASDRKRHGPNDQPLAGLNTVYVLWVMVYVLGFYRIR